MEHKKVLNVAGKEVEISTGKIAGMAHGSIMLKMGGTVLLAAVTVDNKDTDLDYFPLGVEYIEKMYASGSISGSRFRKREGLPSDEATIKAREVDHSIRSLFPKSFKKAVSVVLTVLAYDGENDPQALTVLGTSLALMQSGVPFAGPCASLIIGINKEEKFIVNPTPDQVEEFEAEFIVSAVDGKLLSLEGWGKEITEEKMGELLDLADKEIRNINSQQVEFIDAIEKSLDINPDDYPNQPVGSEVIEEVKSLKGDAIKEMMFAGRDDRQAKLSEIKTQIVDEMPEDQEISSSDIDSAVEYIARKFVREGILNEDKRVSGRKLDEIRELTAETDILPTVHGSALFSRGQTQSLSIVTLAPKSSQLMIDDMEGEDNKYFMHHYNFPPYSTGEAGRFRYHPGRREVGHGAIGENALMNMVPSVEDFPYTIRVVSEIMSSNGSTSMAATCASSMALMAAGVPLKEQVAGIGIGMVTEDDNEDNYKLLTDIEGLEDFYGDMDFKVCGTKNGITAIQYENKLQGVKFEVIKEAFGVAKNARAKVLEVMNKVITSPRAELAANAPVVETMKIEEDQIGELIGPGGKNIKELVEKSGEFHKVEADISIDDDGTVNITASNKDQLEHVKNAIINMFKKPEVGEVYDAVVDKVTNYGAFVDLVDANAGGLIHVSELSDKFVKDAAEVVKPGEKFKVKVLKIDEKGRVNFTRKGVE